MLNINLNEEDFFWKNNDPSSVFWTEITLKNKNTDEDMLYHQHNGELITGYKTFEYQNNSFSLWIEQINFPYNQKPYINFLITYNFEEYYNEDYNWEPKQFQSNLNISVEVNNLDILDQEIHTFTNKGEEFSFSLNLNDYDDVAKSDKYNINITLYTLQGYRQVFNYEVEYLTEKINNEKDFTKSEDSYVSNAVFDINLISNESFYLVKTNDYDDLEYIEEDQYITLSSNPLLVSDFYSDVYWIFKLNENHLFNPIEEFDKSTLFITLNNEKLFEYELKWTYTEADNTFYLIPKNYYYYNTYEDSVIESETENYKYEQKLLIEQKYINEKLELELFFEVNDSNYVINLPFILKNRSSKELNIEYYDQRITNDYFEKYTCIIDFNNHNDISKERCYKNVSI